MKGERGLVLVPACLHQFAAESHSRIPGPRPNLASTGCAASVPSRLDSGCWRLQFLPTATAHHHDGLSKRLYRSSMGASAYGSVVGSRLAAGRSGVCAFKNDSPHEGDREHAMRRSMQPGASPKPRNMDMNQAQSSQLDRMPPFIKPSGIVR